MSESYGEFLLENLQKTVRHNNTVSNSTTCPVLYQYTSINIYDSNNCGQKINRFNNVTTKNDSCDNKF